MMETSIKALWWRWWGNPLVNLHEDQKKRLYIPVSDDEQPRYADIESLRTTLGLALMPETGIISSPHYGVLVMCEPVDLIESRNKLAAFTFDEGVLKFGQAEWESRFQIRDKDHIRGLITLSRSVPEELKPLAKTLALACTEQNRVGVLTLLERTQIVLSIFFSYRFPAFNQRWLLNLSDALLYAIDQVGKLEPEVADSYCRFVEPEIPGLIDQIRQRYEVPEIDFRTLEDYESQAARR